MSFLSADTNVAGRVVPGPARSIVQVGVDRRTVSLDDLAELHKARRDDPIAAGGGVVALATCHRLELYCESVGVEECLSAFCGWLGNHMAVKQARVRESTEAARHLLRVAAGLESALLGEDQILGQLRQAYRVACARECSGPLLHRLFHAAFRAGRRARGETELGSGTRSLAGVGVAAANRVLGSLRHRAVLVLGAGEMAEGSARLLATRGVGRLIVCNRTLDRAEALAASQGGEAVPWEWRERVLPSVDVVVCATRSTGPILGAPELERAVRLRREPLVVVDLGMPPNVGATDVAGIERFDVDSLAALLDEEARRRARAVEAAEAIIEEELEAWLEWTGSREQRSSQCAAG
jgi:glutamyl-tRNA reductase